MHNAHTPNVLLRVVAMESTRVAVVQEAFWECATYLGFKLEKVQLREYAKELLEEHLDPDDIIYALKQIRRQPDRRRYGVPLPAEILQFLRPKLDDTDQANEIAACIQLCYSKFGYNKAMQACQYMGPVAWDVVCQSGGWEEMCRNSACDRGTERAQLRDLARAALRRQTVQERAEALDAHRSNRSEHLNAPPLSPQELALNKRRAAQLVESVFSKSATKAPI